MEKFGRYEILEEIGRGGFGRVLRANDPVMKRQVAIKVIASTGDPDLLARFRNEAAAAGHLRHENIITIHDFGEEGGVPYIVMEYLQGMDLQQVQARNIAKSLLEKVRILCQTAAGLEAAHAAGVIHRDVKPANIMILNDGSVKLMDFGIARLNEDNATRLTRTGMVVGTLQYIAPEQFEGEPVDTMADLWGFGVIAFQLLSGRNPFDGSDTANVIFRITSRRIPDIRTVSPGIPEDLANVVTRLLRGERADRFQSFEDVRLELNPIHERLETLEAARLVEHAQDLALRGELNAAQKILRQVLDRHPSNAQARQLRDQIVAQIRSNETKQQVEEFVRKGEQEVAQGRFAEAVVAFESALRLDRENPAVRGHIEQTRGKIKSSELLAEARREFDQQNFAAAQRTISEALRCDPQNREAAELLKTIQAAVELREAQRRMDEAIHKAQSLVPAYDEAIAVLTGLGRDAESPKVRQVLEWMRAEKFAQAQKQKLHNEMAAATDLLRKQELEQAVKCLENLQQEFSDNEEVIHLLAYSRKELAAQRRTKAVEGVVRETNGLMESHNFEGALATLNEALKTYPGEPALTGLLGSTRAAKNSWERQQAVQSAVAKAEALRSHGRFAEAIETVESMLRKYPAEPTLLSLLEQLEREWAQQRRKEWVRKAKEQAEKSLEHGQTEDAIKLIQQALGKFPKEPLLEEVLARAQTELRAREKAIAVEAIRSAASGHVAAQQFDVALQVLDQGLQEWPGDYTLIRLSEETLAAKHAWERQNAIDEIAARVSQHLRDERFADALDLLRQSLAAYPDETSLGELSTHVENAEKEYKRRQAILNTASGARLLITRGLLDEAIAILNEALHENPEEAELLRLASHAQGALHARQLRREAIDKASHEATGMLDQGRLQEAVQLLQEAAATYPEESRWKPLLKRARSELAAREREEAIVRLVDGALDLAKESRFEDALGILGGGLKNWPDENRLLHLSLSILAAKEAWQRTQALQKAIEKVRSLGADRHYTDALSAAEAALEQHTGDATLLQLCKEFRFRQGIGEARRLLEERQPLEALEVLGKCATGNATDPEVRGLIDEAHTAIRAAALEKRVQEARTRASAGDFDGAVALLEESLREWPDESAVREIRDAMLVQRAARQRQEAVNSAVTQCEELEHQGTLEAAIGLVDSFLTDYPDEPALFEVRNRLEAKLAHQARRLQRQHALDELKALEDANIRTSSLPQAAEMLALARRILSQYSSDEEVQSVAAGPIRHLTDIERAGKEVAQQNFEAALEICEPYLAEHADHVAFGELKRKAELGQRTRYLHEIHSRAAGEQDLQKRSQILVEAHQRYPDDTAIADELRFARNKLALADSIAEKARGCEQAGRWIEAQDEWNKLAPIYGQYPELESAFERVQHSLAKVRSEAVEQWTRQIGEALTAGEPDRAAELLQQAQTEFPGADRFQNLALQVRDLAEKKKRAVELLSQAEVAGKNGNYNECRECLRQAFQIETADAFRKLVLNKLISYAQSALQSDWRQAEALIREAMTLQPGYAPADGVLQTIAERKKEAAVEECQAKAEQFRKEGNIRTALAEVEQVLPSFPKESRLKKLRDALAAQVRREREHLAAELRRISKSAEAATQVSEIAPWRSRAAAIAAGNQDDPQLVDLASETLVSLDRRVKELKQARIRVWIASHKFVVGAAAAALVLGAVAARQMLRGTEEVPVSVTVNVTGASVTVGPNNCVTPNCALKLGPGTYTVRVSKEGYNPITQPLTLLRRQTAVTLSLTLQPLPELVQVSTNFEGGLVYLDGRRPEELRDGQYSASGIKPGPHTIRVTGGGAEFRGEWTSAAAAPPQGLHVAVAKDLQATMVANAGSAGSIACNCDTRDLKVDDVPVPSTGSTATLKDLKEGLRRISVGGRSPLVDVRSNPSLNLFLSLDRNTGMLVVKTNEDAVRVFVDNRPSSRTTEHGILRIPLDVAEYSIRVEKDGFQPLPLRRVTLKKGDTTEVSFNLVAAPAYLLIDGAEAGAQVKIDGVSVGATYPDGGFRHPVQPGLHAIELNKQGYVLVKSEGVFSRGVPTRLHMSMTRESKTPVLIGEPPPPDPRLIDPGSARADQALALAAGLGENQKEKDAWEKVDPRNKEELEVYLKLFPNGAHAPAAKQRIAELDRQAQSKLGVDDRRNIIQVFRDIELAYNTKNLESIRRLWPKNQLKNVKQLEGVRYHYQVVSEPVINGNSATLDCTLTTSIKSEPEKRLRVTMSREVSRWVIDSMQTIK